MNNDDITWIEAALDANDALIAHAALQIARDGMVARDREIERLMALNARFAKFIASHHEGFYGDWACSLCHPSSEILIQGFLCAYHEAEVIATDLDYE